MQLKQVAELAGVENREIMEVLEEHREEFQAQGFKIAKRLTASSAIKDDLASLVLAYHDQKKQANAQAEEAAREKRQAEELARQQEVARRQHEQEEEERRRLEEERRRKLEEELARKRQEMERLQAEQAAREKAEAEAHSAPEPAAPAQREPARPQAPVAPRGGRPAAPQAPGGEVAQPKTPPAPQQRPAASREGAPGQRTATPARPAQPRDARDSRERERPAAQRKEKQEEGRPAQVADLQSFVEAGLGTDVTDDYAKAKARRGPAAKKAKTARPQTTEWEGKRTRRPAPKVEGDVPGRKKIGPSQIFRLDPSVDRRPKGPGGKRKSGPPSGRQHPSQPTRSQGPKVVRLMGDFTVGEFADKLDIPAAEIIKRLFLMGHPLTINQLMDPDLAEELAIELEREVQVVRESDESDVAKYLTDPPAEEESLAPRAPVVTVMGHVDHGKTSLLDRIRAADVASGEFGGITQHIGAYHVMTPKGNIVFLDTPGHAAFTEMRSRGANITDVVILVVAANDGVMPQTIEAINHAKAANVPIIVAINKVDVEGANPTKVKQELMAHDLIAEEYGGDTIMLPVSAMTGAGIDNLMEYIALQTEIMELKANPNRPAIGTVVESHLDPFRGPVATILVERGTLKVGDIFVCGTEYGRVRAMRDDRDNALETAEPVMPVEILGLKGAPEAGERFVVLPTESEAREIAERRAHRRRTRRAQVKEHISLENLRDRMSDDDVVTLNMIVKGDVQGSVQAIVSSLLKIRSDKVAIKILHSAVGSVGRADVQLADASEAIILAFNVGIEPGARDLAEEYGVDVRSYNVIYALLEDVEKAMLGLLEPEFDEKEEGRAKVLQTFKVSKVGTVAGCLVEEGAVGIGHKARLVRNGAVIWTGKLRSLRRVKDDVKEVLAGVECGIGLENFNDIKVGDSIETYSLVEREISLVSTGASKGNDDDS